MCHHRKKDQVRFSMKSLQEEHSCDTSMCLDLNIFGEALYNVTAKVKVNLNIVDSLFFLANYFEQTNKCFSKCNMYIEIKFYTYRKRVFTGDVGNVLLMKMLLLNCVFFSVSQLTCLVPRSVTSQLSKSSSDTFTTPSRSSSVPAKEHTH